MNKTVIQLAVLMLCKLCMAQSDTLLSKERIQLKNLDVWNSISEQDSLTDEFKHLDGLAFFAITYASDGHVVNGFAIEPLADGNYPVILFNRGGNRDFGALSIKTMLSYTSKLAADGYVILASNYRTVDEFGGNELNDVLKLIELSSTFSLADTSRIGMFGWSRGGMMAYLAMAKTTRLKTVVVGNGPTDLNSTLAERPALEESVFSQCIPNYWQNKETELYNRSVINWTEKLHPQTSLLLLAATNDKHVNCNHAKTLAALLAKKRTNFALKLYETDHFFSDKKDELNTVLLSWFSTQLK